MRDKRKSKNQIQRQHKPSSKLPQRSPEYKPHTVPDLELPDEFDASMQEAFNRLDLSPEKRAELLSFVSIAVTKSSPIPDAAQFKAYKDVDPTIPAIIMEDFAKTRQHRRDMERLSVTEHVKYKRRGQYCGVAIVIGFLATGALIAIFANVVAGSLVAGAGLFLALARSFLRANLFGTRDEPSENDQPTAPKPEK